MTTPPKRRLLDRLAGSPTFLGEHARFTGDIECPGPFVLCGHITGNGRIDGPLKLAASGSWEGHIVASEAIIGGQIVGNLVVHGKIEIGASAIIHGSVTAQFIAIAQGAVVDGDIVITGQAPLVRFEEKRG